MNTLKELSRIVDAAWEEDLDTDGGYVAEVDSILLAKSYCKQLSDAGYDTSWSTDDRLDRQHAYVWAAPK